MPEFEKETGIKVEWELLNHFEVINKGQADMLSGRGYYDAVMLHGFQLGPMLSAGVIRPIDDLVEEPETVQSGARHRRLHPSPYKIAAFYKGKQYGFINWNYNQVYWARADLLNNPEEQAAFKAKYGYDLAPAKTIEQMRDIAEFFTRKKGEKLAGKPLESDFYGIVLEGIKGGSTFWRAVEQLHQELRRRHHRRRRQADLRPAGERRGDQDVGRSSGSSRRPASPSIRWSTCRPSWATASPPRPSPGRDFVLGVDKPGVSPFAGKFVYAPVPVKAGRTAAHAPRPSRPSP